MSRYARILTSLLRLLSEEGINEIGCLSQTHIDIVEDFDQDLVEQLQAIAEKHDFVIWEDRKFADIGKLDQN